MSARDAMEPAVTVPPELPVTDLARLLLERNLDGVCVVRDEVLLGVVTLMDLVYQERSPRMPSFVTFLDAMIPLRSPDRIEEELRKLSGATAADVMSDEVVTATPDTHLDEIAAQMVESHLSLMPVVADGRLVGVIDKRTLIRDAFGIT